MELMATKEAIEFFRKGDTKKFTEFIRKSKNPYIFWRIDDLLNDPEHRPAIILNMISACLKMYQNEEAKSKKLKLTKENLKEEYLKYCVITRNETFSEFLNRFE